MNTQQSSSLVATSRAHLEEERDHLTSCCCFHIFLVESLTTFNNCGHFDSIA